MLSKKMAFSLMSLITIFALAFAASPSAMAQFGVGLSIADDTGIATGGTGANNGDVSAADGIQVERAVLSSLMSSSIKLSTSIPGTPDATDGSGASFGRDDIDIVGYSMFGGTVTVVANLCEHCNTNCSRRSELYGNYTGSKVVPR